MNRKVLIPLSMLLPLLVVAAGLAFDSSMGSEGSRPRLGLETALRAASVELGVSPKALARELGLPLSVDKQRSLRALGVSEPEWREVETHLRSHHGSLTGYALLVALSFFAWFWLLWIGRPADSPSRKRKTWFPSWVPVVVALLAVALAGFATGKSPNPMETAVKPFKALAGLYDDPGVKWAVLAGFLFLALLGEKLVCGWACPFGAVQELAHRLPGLARWKRRLRFPRALTFAVRGTFFALFLLLLFGVLGGRKGFVLYHGLNPFSLFSLDLDEFWPWISLSVFSLAALVLYRPFCQLVCPFGFLSSLLSPLRLSGVQVDETACTNCGSCARACPTMAMRDRLQKRILGADCFSCSRCLNSCPEDALRYAFRGGKTPQKG